MHLFDIRTTDERVLFIRRRHGASKDDCAQGTFAGQLSADRNKLLQHSSIHDVELGWIADRYSCQSRSPL